MVHNEVITNTVIDLMDAKIFEIIEKNYNNLLNKPSINGIVLEGNKTTKELGIVTEEKDPTVPSHVKSITQEDITNWNKVKTLGKVFNYRGTVQTYAELPNDNLVGDTYNVVEAYGGNAPGTNFAWSDKGTWDALGGDLTDYVKNTDYATNNKAGVVKVASVQGVIMDNNVLSINPANKAAIDAKTSYRLPIVPAWMDYAVKVGLTTNTQEFTADDKKAARDLIGAVGDEDYATASKGGVVKAQNVTTANRGVYVSSEGFLSLKIASEAEIKEKSPSMYNVISPANLDKALKTGLTTNTIELTEEEKAAAQSWLGVDNKLDKPENFPTIALMRYNPNTEKIDFVPTYQGAPAMGQVPMATIGGALNVGTPTSDTHATTKKYVDNLVGDINTALETILGV